MEPPKEIYLIRDAANPQKILGDIASEKPMFSDDIKYIRADLVNSNDLEEAAWDCVLDSVDVNNPVLLPKYKELLTYLFIAGAKWQAKRMKDEEEKE